jgi:hypothetical protein
MNIRYVLIEILLIDYAVRPESTLPNAALPSFMAAFGNSFPPRQGSRESAFEQIPTRRKIRITSGESPYAMQMVRHNDNRVYIKRLSFLNITKRRSQRVDFLNKQIIAATCGRIGGKKPCCPWDVKAAVRCHLLDMEIPIDALPSSAHPIDWSAPRG